MEALVFISQWLAIGQRVYEVGSPLFREIVVLLRAHGVEADYAALDRVIADADARRARAEAEAQALE